MANKLWHLYMYTLYMKDHNRTDRHLVGTLRTKVNDFRKPVSVWTKWSILRLFQINCLLSQWFGWIDSVNFDLLIRLSSVGHVISFWFSYLFSLQIIIIRRNFVIKLLTAIFDILCSLYLWYSVICFVLCFIFRYHININPAQVTRINTVHVI